MDKPHLQAFLDEFAFPEDCKAVFLSAFDRVFGDEQAKNTFLRLFSVYDNDMRADFAPLLEEVRNVGARLDIHEYTISALFYLLLTKRWREYFIQLGIDECIWKDGAKALLEKINGCKQVKNVWGVCAIRWFFNVFRMNVFRLGRLEFFARRFNKFYEKNGLTLTPENMVLDTHIPYTGTRLTHDEVLLSYEKAALFYQKHYGLDRPIFWCKSWLLFPKHKQILSPTSNIFKFLGDFDIFAWGEYENYDETVRLFQKEFTGDFSVLPADTSLRRTYIAWMQAGEKTGWGEGVIDYQALLQTHKN